MKIEKLKINYINIIESLDDLPAMNCQLFRNGTEQIKYIMHRYTKQKNLVLIRSYNMDPNIPFRITSTCDIENLENEKEKHYQKIKKCL